MLRTLALVSLLGAACTGSGINGGADMSGPQGITLVTADYSLTAGQETYLCQRVTLTQDINIHQIIPLNGTATHHQVVGIDPTKKYPDGQMTCDRNTEFDVVNWQLLFASGVGSPSLTMPDGVAISVHAGDQIVLQMHLLNASNNNVNSTATVQVVPMDASLVMAQAQMLLAGPVPDPRLTPSIPVGDGYVVNGQCTLTAAANYFAVFPHMHQIGHHITVSTTVSGATSNVYDSDYSFVNQVFEQITPVIPMKTGDVIGVTCTYNNDTTAPVPFGQSSYDEMCFAISYITPPQPASTFGAFCFQ
jgi:hypothetical protein